VTSTGAPRCRWIGPANTLASGIARWPQRRLLHFGGLCAALLSPLLAQRRRIARTNLALCFPDLASPQRDALLRATMRDTVTGLLESVRAWYAPDAALRGLCTIDGLEHLEAARAQGRGVLLLTGHSPHLELGGRFLADAMRAPLAIVARHNNDPCLERWLDGARRRVFADVIAKKDVRGLLRTLARGDVVAYAADQDFSYQHAFVPFFGVAAAPLTAIPALAQRGNAVVLPYWFAREDDGRYTLRIESPWHDWPSGDEARDAARYMAELERAVRRRPSQYLWVHRRFKTRPPGETDPYSR
jgi:KDO2-lipid IV(A) lauroyltransferase